MALDRASATFGGLAVQVSLAMSITPGVVPDRGQIVWPLNDTQPSNAIGTLNLLWGNDTDGFTTHRAWVDARISRFQEQRGRYLDAIYAVEDRRWRWKFPEITGNYNVRDDKNVVISATVKTPRELATLLLEALGETAFDVTALPTTADLAPETVWLYANAAVELKKLVDMFGCDVHLDADDEVRIKKRGVGTTPGNTNLIDPVVAGLAFEQPPVAIRAFAADTLFDSWLNLEPCVPELNGTIVALDDASFKPAAGWGKCDPQEFFAVTGANDVETKKLRTHCKKYVWRMFRLKGFVGGRTKPPGFDDDLDPDDDPWPDITDMKLLLPLQNNRLEAGLDADGNYQRLPAEIAGSWSPKGYLGAPNLPAYSIWTDGFRLDTAKGYVYLNRAAFRTPPVVFAYANSTARTSFTGYTPTQNDFDHGNLFRDIDTNAIYKLTSWAAGPVVGWASGTAEYKPPVLVLRTAYGLKQEVTGPRYHHTYTLSTGATNGTKFEPLRKTEYQRFCIEAYTSDYTDLSAIGTNYDNKSAVEASLLAAATEYALRYQPSLQPQTGRYHTPVAMDTDGVVQQITYTAGEANEFVQTVSVNFEHDRAQLPAVKRWMQEQDRVQQEESLKRFNTLNTQALINQRIINPFSLFPGL